MTSFAPSIIIDGGIRPSCLIVLNGTAQRISSRVCIVLMKRRRHLYAASLSNRRCEQVSPCRKTPPPLECLIVEIPVPPPLHFCTTVLQVIICFTEFAEAIAPPPLRRNVLINLRVPMEILLPVPMAISRINRDRTTVSGYIAEIVPRI